MRRTVVRSVPCFFQPALNVANPRRFGLRIGSSDGDRPVILGSGSLVFAGRSGGMHAIETQAVQIGKIWPLRIREVEYQGTGADADFFEFVLILFDPVMDRLVRPKVDYKVAGNVGSVEHDNGNRQRRLWSSFGGEPLERAKTKSALNAIVEKIEFRIFACRGLFAAPDLLAWGLVGDLGDRAARPLFGCRTVEQFTD